MFNSLRAKIAIPVIGILIGLVLIIVLFVSFSIQDFADERTEERLVGASQAAQSHLRYLEQYSRMAARVAAGRETVIGLVRDFNAGADLYETREALLEYFGALVEEFGHADFIICGGDTNVILRTHYLERYGDTGFLSPAVRLAFQGEVSTTYTRTSVMPLAMSSSAPIIYGGEVIGSVSLLRGLSHMGFVDDFGAVFNADVSIFAGSTRIATTIYDMQTGERAVGGDAPPEVMEIVIEQRRNFDMIEELYGVTYHTFYFPFIGGLRQYIGQTDITVGMFAISFEMDAAIAATSSLIQTLAVIGILGLLFAAAVMYSQIEKNANRVSRLAQIVENITVGGENADFKDIAASKDEVGVLAVNILTLVQTIKKLSAHLGETNSAMPNITEITNYIEEAERSVIEATVANKAKSDFLSKMSHELRTPISAILGITEILLSNDKRAEEIKEAMEIIHISGDMLLGIINDILDLSKIEEGKMELLIDRYEFASMISDTSQLNIMRIGGKPVEFELAVDEGIPSILIGDELRIKQILSNLLSNAFKYTNEGKVKMSVSKVESDYNESVSLQIIVSDTGQGMTREQIDMLFDNYARFNLRANRETEGVGLGMGITKNLVNMMDGEIIVQSEVGKGTTVIVELPQRIADPTPVGKNTAERLSQFKNIGQLNINKVHVVPMPYAKALVVDDADANIYVAKGMLSPYMLQLDTADSGFSAIEKIRNGAKYDIIFMDHMMPKMDGIEATKILREMGCESPIIAFTANALVGQADEFMKHGFDGFISKPIQTTQLDAILNKFIRNKGENYKKMCADFYKSQKDAIQKIKTALRENDHKTAHILAHTLKSLAGLIGETALMSIALEAEKACRDQTITREIIQELQSEMEKVLDKTAAAVQPAPLFALPLDSAEAQALLDKLEEMLEQNSAEVIQAIDALSAIPNSQPLIKYIEDYDFNRALAELAKLKGN